VVTPRSPTARAAGSAPAAQAGASSLRPSTGLRGITAVAVAGFVLVLGLLAVALQQTRQHTQLRQLAQDPSEAQALAVAQVQTDFLHLREQWRNALDERLAPDISGLQQHLGRWGAGVQALHQQLTPAGPVALSDTSCCWANRSMSRRTPRRVPRQT
jgi:hypothetical protein